MSDLINIRAIVITLGDGIPLFTLKIDKNVDEVMLTAFLSAVKMLAKGNMKSTEEMFINSGDDLIYCLHKNYEGLDIILCVLRGKLIGNENIRKPAEYALDSFVHYFGIRYLKNWDGNVAIFEEFAEKLQAQIDRYDPSGASDDNGGSENISESKFGSGEKPRKGFFAAIKSFFKAT